MAEKPQPAKISCPHCAAMIKSPGLPAGSAVNCPKCGKAFRVGQAASVEGRKPKAEAQGVEVRGPRSEVSSRKETAKPDTLVDPNLLAPPPPRAKPKAQEIAVVCKVCGTRTYAPLERAGQEVKCPDCYSRIIVPSPAGAAVEKKPTGPTLEGTEEFGMSEVVERPKYRPLVVPRGEYEVLSAMDPASIEHRLTVPDEGKAAVGNKGHGSGNSGRPRAVVEPVDEEPAPQDSDVVLAPPVERSEAARDPRTILPQPDLEPEDPMYDGRYEGGAIGDGVDPRAPDAWKRAPLVVGILGFLFRPPTLLRLIFFGVGLVAVSMAGRSGFALARAGGENQLYALIVLFVTIPFGATWLIAFTAAIQGVIEATANGDDDVSSWPDFNVFDWFGASRFILVATFVASLPGTLAGGATLAASMGDPMMAAFGVAAPPVMSWMVLFPMVLYSMLAEDSALAIFSRDAIGNLKEAADGWVIFYMYSIVLVIVAAFAAAVMVGGSAIPATAGAIGLVALLILYARLLGRLMWYAGNKGIEQSSGRGAGVRIQRLGGTA